MLSACSEGSRITHGRRYDFTAEISADNLTKDSRRMTRAGDPMSWTYWGIVIGLAALVVMLIACIRLLASNGNEDRQGLRQDASGSDDLHSEPSIITRRAA